MKIQPGTSKYMNKTAFFQPKLLERSSCILMDTLFECGEHWLNKKGARTAKKTQHSGVANKIKAIIGFLQSTEKSLEKMPFIQSNYGPKYH